MSDLPANGLTASEAREKINQGWLTSRELVEACLSQIEQTDSTLKAWEYVDREGALERADKLDEIRSKGMPTGVLHGIPVGLKDIVDTKTMATQRGSSIFAGRKPEADARIVDALIEAGAVILGKTVTTELAFVTPSRTRNPHNPEHTPGGSSSGSAAAVAGFHVPLAIGTQTNGSVIRPASYCCTYAMKPSRGMVPRTGVLQTSNSLDQVGCFARSLEDCAMLTDVIMQHDPLDEKSYENARPKLLESCHSEPPVEPDLVWLNLPYHDRFSDDVNEGFEEVIDALGRQIERITPPETIADLIEVQRIIHEYEFANGLNDHLTSNWEKVSDVLKPIVERGQQISESEYTSALANMENAGSYFNEFFKDYDAILTPAATGEAPMFDEGTGDAICSTIWTLCGLPCITLPVLQGSRGLPIGIQLVGGWLEDDRLMRTSSWLQNQLGNTE